MHLRFTAEVHQRGFACFKRCPALDLPPLNPRDNSLRQGAAVRLGGVPSHPRCIVVHKGHRFYALSTSAEKVSVKEEEGDQGERRPLREASLA